MVDWEQREVDVQRANEETVFATRFSDGAIPTEFGKDDER
jgi:hypothetical protein